MVKCHGAIFPDIVAKVIFFVLMPEKFCTLMLSKFQIRKENWLRAGEELTAWKMVVLKIQKFCFNVNCCSFAEVHFRTPCIRIVDPVF